MKREPKTGITFPVQQGTAKLQKMGVRTKGPIKVYAVGEYKNGDFMIKMSYGVSAAKMSNALADALKVRFSDEKLISDFKKGLTSGLPNGAPKGTEMVFHTGGGKLTADVNGKRVAMIPSKDMATAFANIYRDGNALCHLQMISTLGSEDFMYPTGTWERVARGITDRRKATQEYYRR
jgi:hypothetical protein